MRDFTLPELCQLFREENGEDAPRYVRVHRRVAEGRIPAVQRGKMWFVAERHLDVARRALNLPAPPAKAA